eukprot:CAMPEP_0178928506 /NCGR_PEP_ID=MMETSP0786-20121207/19945_1 /TAXON_ID=186022 /ORGANISM="Thalassionema frauenfeldii, Strain CCMP 1798" /LENGTH=560 /DNA_ID=CAMNT_0020604385 /DNA_START=1129 /DNA_END=2812 /DNA_ORIENTATION=-
MTPSNKLIQEAVSSSSLNFMSRTGSPSSDGENGESDNLPATLSGPLQNHETKKQQTHNEIYKMKMHEPRIGEATDASDMNESSCVTSDTKGARSSAIHQCQIAEVRTQNPGATQKATRNNELPEVPPVNALTTPTKLAKNAPNFDKSNNMALRGEKRPDISSDVALASSARSGITPPLEQAGISSEPQVPSTVEVPANPRVSPSSHLLNPILPKSRSEGQHGTVIHQVESSKQTTSPIGSKYKQTSSLRRGKWTAEEEAYVARVIQDFNSGYLNAPAGTTLRSYLSEKLHCDPMRITKKFTGAACIGKRVFHPAVRCPSNTAAIDKAQEVLALFLFIMNSFPDYLHFPHPNQAELDALERRWRRRLEIQQRESAKKAAASAAAAAATGRHTFNTGNAQATDSVATVPNVQSQHLQKSLVTKTASWLDRANAILSGGQSLTGAPENSDSSNSGQDHAQAIKGLPQNEIEDQMKEVQRLIHEGPIIQQSTAGLPHLLEQVSKPIPSKPAVSSPGEREPADKRLRRCTASDRSGAEDAEALVGFLNSVRAAASAAGTTTGHAE